MDTSASSPLAAGKPQLYLAAFGLRLRRKRPEKASQPSGDPVLPVACSLSRSEILAKPQLSRSQRTSSRERWFGIALLLFAVLAAAALRLIWVGDMEYKLDEQYMFQRVIGAGATEPWPRLGMPSGVQLRNPGLSIWVFLLLGRLFGATQPTELARVVQFLNIAAISLAGLFAWRCIASAEREPWLWAVALAAVNPLAVMYQRKIWRSRFFLFFSAPVDRLVEARTAVGRVSLGPARDFHRADSHERLFFCGRIFRLDRAFRKSEKNCLETLDRGDAVGRFTGDSLDRSPGLGTGGIPCRTWSGRSRAAQVLRVYG